MTGPMRDAFDAWLVANGTHPGLVDKGFCVPKPEMIWIAAYTAALDAAAKACDARADFARSAALGHASDSDDADRFDGDADECLRCADAIRALRDAA